MKYKVMEIDLLEFYAGEKLLFSPPRIEDKLNKMTEDGLLEIVSVFPLPHLSGNTFGNPDDDASLIVILRDPCNRC